MDNLQYTQTLSLNTLMLINYQDFGLIMFFLLKAMENSRTFNYFLLMFIMFIFLTTFLSMRILLFTWRIKNNFISNNLINTAEFRKKFYLFQIKFYLLMLTYYTLMHVVFVFHPVIILISSFIFFPQIINNLGIQLQEFDTDYLMFFGLPRFLIFLYIRGCPYNIQELAPSPYMMGFSALVLTLSILVIYFQIHYGSYFFVPRCFRTQQFNYFIQISKLKELLSQNFSFDALTNQIKKEKVSKYSAFKSCIKKIFERKKSNEINTSYSANNDTTLDIKHTDDSLISKNSSNSGINLKDTDFIKIEAIEKISEDSQQTFLSGR